MPIINPVEAEENATLVIAKLLATTALTAPKWRGDDRAITPIVTGAEKE